MEGSTMRNVASVLVFCLVFVFLNGVGSAEYYVGDNFPSDEDLIYNLQGFFGPPTKLKIVGKRQESDEVFSLFVDCKMAQEWVVQRFEVYKTDRGNWIIESELHDRYLVVRKAKKQE
jgi:hypothetical protein